MRDITTSELSKYYFLTQIIIITSKGKKHLKKMKGDVGMTKNSVQKNKETREEIVERKRFDLLSSLHQAYEWNYCM